MDRIDGFYQKLALPETCHLGKRVFKKLFYENAALNAADKKAFTEAIDDIHWLYTLKPETINIARFQDEAHDYAEVAILQVNLKDKKPYKRIAQVIQRAIPYPLMIVFVEGSNMALSLADKRINRADREKITVAAFYETDWLNLVHLTEAEQAFLDSCAITCFSFNNFYEFYGDLTARVIALNCARLSGTFTLEHALCQEERIDLLNCIRQTQQQLAELRAALKNESQFNRKVQLNMKIKRLDVELNDLKEKI